MLHHLDLPESRFAAIEYIATTFQVTYEFAKERLTHFENQITGALFLKELNMHFTNHQQIQEQPDSIDLYDDLPFWEQPDFKSFLADLEKAGFKENEIKNIVNQIKRKEAATHSQQGN